MPPTVVVLEFRVTIAAPDRWTSEHRHAADQTHTSSWDGWVEQQLHDRMSTAAQEFVDANPDLFVIGPHPAGSITSGV